MTLATRRAFQLLSNLSYRAVSDGYYSEDWRGYYATVGTYRNG